MLALHKQGFDVFLYTVVVKHFHNAVAILNVIHVIPLFTFADHFFLRRRQNKRHRRYQVLDDVVLRGVHYWFIYTPRKAKILSDGPS